MNREKFISTLNDAVAISIKNIQNYEFPDESKNLAVTMYEVLINDKSFLRLMHREKENDYHFDSNITIDSEKCSITVDDFYKEQLIKGKNKLLPDFEELENGCDEKSFELFYSFVISCFVLQLIEKNEELTSVKIVTFGSEEIDFDLS